MKNAAGLLRRFFISVRNCAQKIFSCSGSFARQYNPCMVETEQGEGIHPRATLLAAALDLIEEQGPLGFALPAVARRAQLPLESLQQHFATKDDLMMAIAEEGYAQLTETMEQAMERGADAAERMNLCACAYVDFATRFPRHFAVMFDLPSSLRDQRPCEPKTMNGFGVLIRAIEQMQAEGRLPAGDPVPMGMTAWALVHGIAKLATSGTLPLPHAPLLAFTLRAAEQMTRGLGAVEDRSAPACEDEKPRLDQIGNFSRPRM
jgi:AcrR family transcriptional regulator